MNSLPRKGAVLALAGLLMAATGACGGVTSPFGACTPAPGQIAVGRLVGGQVRIPVAIAEVGASQSYAREVTVSGGDIFLADAAGRAFPGKTVLTDTQGQYQMVGVPEGQTVVVTARVKTPAGSPLELRGLGKPGPQGATAAINVATTIATTALLEGQRGAVGDYDKAAYESLVSKVYSKLDAVTNLDLTNEAAINAQFKTWMASDTAMQALYDKLRATITAPQLTLDEQLRAIEAAQGYPPRPSVATAIPTVLPMPTPVATPWETQGLPQGLQGIDHEPAPYVPTPIPTAWRGTNPHLDQPYPAVISPRPAP